MQDLELKEVDVAEETAKEAVLESISSPALLRLIEEVRNDDNASPQNYNRFHNRHNRTR